MIQKINYADKQTGGKFSASDANAIKNTVNLNADVLSENSQSILSLQGGQLGPIKPTDAAPTPARNGNYTFSIGGNKPAWLTAEAGVTTVKAGDGVAVVYTAPSTYTYTHIKIDRISDIYNVTNEIPLAVGQYYTSATARAAVPSANRKLGLKITYSTAYGTWVTEQFVGNPVGNWAVGSMWELAIKQSNLDNENIANLSKSIYSNFDGTEIAESVTGYYIFEQAITELPAFTASGKTITFNNTTGSKQRVSCKNVEYIIGNGYRTVLITDSNNIPIYRTDQHGDMIFILKAGWKIQASCERMFYGGTFSNLKDALSLKANITDLEITTDITANNSILIPAWALLSFTGTLSADSNSGTMVAYRYLVTPLNRYNIKLRVYLNAGYSSMAYAFYSSLTVQNDTTFLEGSSVFTNIVQVQNYTLTAPEDALVLVVLNSNIVNLSVNRITDVKNAISLQPDSLLPIVCTGDSLTYGAGSDKTTNKATVIAKLSSLEIDTTTLTNGNPSYPVTMQAVLGSLYSVFNLGVGGETLQTIAARQGAAPAIIANQFTLPATAGTKVEIANSSTNTLKSSFDFSSHVLPLAQGDGNSVNPCYVEGIECTLSIIKDTVNRYYLTRTVSGIRDIVIPAQTSIIMSGSKKYRNPKAAILWCWENGGYSDDNDLIIKLDKIISNLGTSNFIIVGLHSGTSASRAAQEQALTIKYGCRFFNWRKYVSTNALYDFGITPTTDADLTAPQIANGVKSDTYQMSIGSLPSSLWRMVYGVDGDVLNDTTHMNAAGYMILGYKLVERLKIIGAIQ